MSKKVFTKSFPLSLSTITDVELDKEPQSFWLLQEDVEVIGCDLDIFCNSRSQNDGESYAYVELSQVGMLNADGMIASVSASEGWNTTPAGIEKARGHTTVMFNDGHSISVREEGYLYINTRTAGKSAGAGTWLGQIIVYYTKRTGRSR